MILISCGSPKKEERTNLPKGKEINPLDNVLGDKFISEKDTIRVNNFKDFIGISIDNIKKGSKHYKIVKMEENFYLLQQQKVYSEARNFNALLKIVDGEILKYYIFNDFKIVDFQFFENGIVLLCDNFENHNKYWVTENRIVVTKLDTNFTKVWEYSAPNEKTNFPLQANSFQKNQNEVTCLIKVITGCHICYKLVELKIDNANGKYISSIEINEENSRDYMPQEVIDGIFD